MDPSSFRAGYEQEFQLNDTRKFRLIEEFVSAV